MRFCFIPTKLRFTACFLGIGCLLAVLFCGAPAKASSAIDEIQADHLRVALVADRTHVAPGGQVTAAFRFRMQPGWHVYWKNPGDSGEPVRAKWTAPAGVHVGEILWPAPQRISIPPLANYGYEGEVFLPVRVQIDPGFRNAQVLLKAHVTWLVCHEECVPGKADLKLPLELTDHEAVEAAAPLAPAIAETLAHLPRADAKLQATAKIDHQRLILDFAGADAAGVRQALYFPESENLLQNGDPQELTPLEHGFRLSLPLSNLFQSGRDTLKGLIEIPGRDAAEVTPQWASATALNASELVTSSVFAFLAGVILNLMPCVLPVLFLKILGLSQLSHLDRARRHRHEAAYVVGILVSFWILAGALLLLRAGGERLGWGFQLQSPVFVTILVFLLTAMALNLFGVFEVGGGWTGAGQSLTQSSSAVVGEFFSGALAVVVATPCTAPFMGAALAFALAQPAYVALLVFTSLALGLAAPFLFLAEWPALRERVPRPGAWMNTFKQLLGFPLLGTALWLLSVLMAQTSPFALPRLLAILLIFAFALWALPLASRRKSPLAARAVFGLVVILAFGALLAAVELVHIFPRGGSSENAAATQNGGWQKFSVTKLQSALARRQPVFIDFTAAWCITCQVNERMALKTSNVQRKFTEKNVLLMKADWTNLDSEITAQLETYGRDSVPVYALYLANGEAVILPQILTPARVLEELNRL